MDGLGARPDTTPEGEETIEEGQEEREEEAVKAFGYAGRDAAEYRYYHDMAYSYMRASEKMDISSQRFQSRWTCVSKIRRTLFDERMNHWVGVWAVLRIGG